MGGCRYLRSKNKNFPFPTFITLFTSFVLYLSPWHVGIVSYKEKTPCVKESWKDSNDGEV